MKPGVFFLLIAIFSSSCKKDASTPGPIACFSADKYETADEIHTFSFTSCSQNASYFYWDFGDGGFSGYPSTTHIYYAYGNFNVRLRVTASDGTENTVTKTITIGHYSLSKIIFTAVVSSLPVHCRVRTGSDTLAYININGSADLPYTISFADSAFNDVTTLYPVYYYDELDSSGNTIWTTSHGISIQEIETSPGNKIDFSLLHNSAYAEFSIYYRFVNR